MARKEAEGMKFFATGFGVRTACLLIAVLGANQDRADSVQSTFAVVRVKPERADERVGGAADLAHADPRIFSPRAAPFGGRRIGD